MERHERAVANTLGFAREAASSGDFQRAVEWLDVVEIVDGALSPEWEQTRDVWRGQRMTAEAGHERAAARAEDGGSREEAG